jgi:hypothetical protein
VETQILPIPISNNDFMGVSSSDFYCRACESPHHEETCWVFVQIAHLFVHDSLKEAFEQPEDSLNMLSMVEEDNFP